MGPFFQYKGYKIYDAQNEPYKSTDDKSYPNAVNNLPGGDAVDIKNQQFGKMEFVKRNESDKHQQEALQGRQ